VRPLLLDLFCCSGLAAQGYLRAGFDVVGFDTDPKCRRYYPGTFFVGDALKAIEEIELLEKHLGRRVEAIHASPPCQGYSAGALAAGTEGKHPRLIAEVREAMRPTDRPTVIENVIGAPLQRWIELRGQQFGLQVVRPRRFELRGFFCWSPPSAPIGAIYLDASKRAGKWRDGRPGRRGVAVFPNGRTSSYAGASESCAAMGADHKGRPMYMVGEGIPPAYTEFLGAAILKSIRE
jgi:DNA (cytosine-5)-methyltransferase 1